LFDISSPSEGILFSICAATRDFQDHQLEHRLFLFLFLWRTPACLTSQTQWWVAIRLRWSAIQDVLRDERWKQVWLHELHQSWLLSCRSETMIRSWSRKCELVRKYHLRTKYSFFPPFHSTCNSICCFKKRPGIEMSLDSPQCRAVNV
jgi:hypothetical protein